MKSKLMICDKNLIFLYGILFLLFILIFPLMSTKENYTGASENSFCEQYTGNTLNEKCKNLTFKNCNKTNCCIFEKYGSCMAGNREGPLFNTDKNGKTKEMTYYFKNNCYGCN